MLATVLLVAACAAPGPPAGSGGGDAGGDTGGDGPEPLPSPWAFEDTGVRATAPLSLAELEGGYAAALAAVGSIRPTDAHDAYQEALRRGDDACPTFVDHNGQTLAVGGCAAESGTGFYGYQLLLALDDRDFDFGDGPQHHAHLLWMSGSFRALDDTDGYAFAAAGDLRYREYDPGDGSTVRDLAVWGDFTTTSPDHAGTWVGAGWGVQLTRVERLTDTDRTVSLDGTVSGLDGVLPVVQLDGVALDEATCAIEPVGTVSTWDANGRRYDLGFGAGEGEAACDGCGSLTSGGEALGELCGPWAW